MYMYRLSGQSSSLKGAGTVRSRPARRVGARCTTALPSRSISAAVPAAWPKTACRSSTMASVNELVLVPRKYSAMPQMAISTLAASARALRSSGSACATSAPRLRGDEARGRCTARPGRTEAGAHRRGVVALRREERLDDAQLLRVVAVGGQEDCRAAQQRGMRAGAGARVRRDGVRSRWGEAAGRTMAHAVFLHDAARVRGHLARVLQHSALRAAGEQEVCPPPVDGQEGVGAKRACHELGSHVIGRLLEAHERPKPQGALAATRGGKRVGYCCAEPRGSGVCGSPPGTASDRRCWRRQ